MGQTVRELFRHYHVLSEAEIQKIVKECIFVFDTNSLLNIYRYNDDTRIIWIRILSKVQDRLFVPYQAISEFYNNRISTILEQKKKFQELSEAISHSLKTLEDGKFQKSFFLKIKEIRDCISPAIAKAKAIIEQQENSHPDLVRVDPYLEEIVNVIGESVGSPPTESQLAQLFADAQKRIDTDTPPGYKDKGKPLPQRYGDVLIWFEVIALAKSKGKPIVFITDDDKEDWWEKTEGKKNGPRIELRRELIREANVDFHIFNPSYLLKIAKDEFGIEIPNETIENAKSVSKEVNFQREAQRVTRLITELGIDPRFQYFETSLSPTEFGFLAKEAVFKWLQNNMSYSKILEMHSRKFPDYTVVTKDEKIAVEIKAIRDMNLSRLCTRLRDLTSHANSQILLGEFSRFLIFLVYKGQKEAQAAKLYCMEELSDGSISNLIFGHLNPEKTFVSLI